MRAPDRRGAPLLEVVDAGVVRRVRLLLPRRRRCRLLPHRHSRFPLPPQLYRVLRRDARRLQAAGRKVVIVRG